MKTLTIEQIGNEIRAIIRGEVEVIMIVEGQYENVRSCIKHYHGDLLMVRGAADDNIVLKSTFRSAWQHAVKISKEL